MDTDHRSVPEQLGEQPQGGAVVGVVEGRDQDARVRDVEVGIARREPPALEAQRLGHREEGDLRLRAILEAHAFQPLAVFLEGPIVRVFGIGLSAQDDCPAAHEAAQVIHVAVGVVARDAAAEPEDVRRAEVIAQHALEVGPREPGIPDLGLRIQQTFFSRQQGADAVHVDAAPFEDHGTCGLDARQPELLRDQIRDAVVLLPVAILGPAVEVEACDRRLRARPRSFDEDRAEVASPAAVGGESEEVDALSPHPDLLEHAPGRGLTRGGVDEDADALAGRQPAHDLRIHPGDGGELARPIGGVVGPPDPRRRVRLPLGRHAEAERAGRGRLRGRRHLRGVV